MSDMSHKHMSYSEVLWSCEFATMYYGSQKQVSHALHVPVEK